MDMGCQTLPIPPISNKKTWLNTCWVFVCIFDVNIYLDFDYTIERKMSIQLIVAGA